MSKLIVLVGVPFSGKSTWARNFISCNSKQTNDEVVRIDPKEIKEMLIGNKKPGDELKIGIEYMVDSLVETSLALDKTVIYDACNISMKKINSLIKKWSIYTDICFMRFEISLEEMRKRNIAYSFDYNVNVMSQKSMEIYLKSYQNLKDNFDFKLIKQKENGYLV